MNSRTHAIVSLAAATFLGAGVLAMGADPTPAANSDNGNQPAAQQATGSNQEVDRQVVSELEQFSRDAKTAPDKMFVLNADLSSNEEIQIAQQALGKTKNTQITNLANHLIRDHEKLNQQLQQVAGKLSVELPQGMPEVTKAEIDALGALSGHDYETQLLATLNADHEKDIACFRATAANSQNADVKQLAEQSTPILQQHLEMVQQTAVAAGVNLGSQGQATPAAAHIPGAHGNEMNTGNGGAPGTGGPQNPTR